jgi:hypothetical protein
VSENGIEREMSDLEQAETWDFDKAELHPPSKGNRVVVSVAFPRPGFAQVEKCAEHLGMRVSEFIREAALEKATRHVESGSLTTVSGPFAGAIRFNGRISSGSPSITRVPGAAWIPNGTPVYRQSEFVNQPATV